MRQVDDVFVSRGKLNTLEVVADGIGQFHAFCNVGFVWGGGEVLAVDTSNPRMGGNAVKALREITSEPIALVVYTHGHVDHVGGAPAFLAHAEELGHARPSIWAHENLPARLERYSATWGWNNEVNRRQFQLPDGVNAFPRKFVYPDRTYRDGVRLELAGEAVELYPARAETDDATWVWLPERETALVGDLSVQSIPNTGNPNKAQRYTLGWAEALEAIARHRPKTVIPGHGESLQGDYALEVLQETARALRHLHNAVLERLNAGQWPDEIVEADIRLPDDLAAKPYLQPIYGHPQFIVRDVLRAYAGWWGGDPAALIPARRADVARDLVDVAGRAELIAQTRRLMREDEPRRALHLAVLLPQSDPGDREGHALVAEVCEALVERERSFIARNFYRVAAAQARSAAEKA